jgi:hypothetical protein
MDRTAGVRFPAGQEGFLYSTVFIPTLKPIEHPNKRILRVLSWGQSGRVVKLTTHLHLLWYLIEHRYNFAFTFI